MSKKSNKTEHVLKLITKNQEPEEETTVPSEQEIEVEENEEVKETTESEEDNLISGDEAAAEEDFSEPEADILPEQSYEEEPEYREPEQEEEISHSQLKEMLKEELKEELKEALKEELKIPKKEENKEEQPEKEPLRVEGHKANPPIIRDVADVGVVNLSELLVLDMMGDVMKKLNMCTCELCKADVIALTLNFIPQKYVTTDAGKQYMQLDIYRKQYETDVLSAITRACVRVKGSPRHN